MDPLEDYHSPFDFEQGVNTSYLYLSPAYGDTPPGSPATVARAALAGGNNNPRQAHPQPHQQQHDRAGRVSQKRPDSIPEVGEDAVTAVSGPPLPPALTDEEREELQADLIKVEDEIQTLSQVLAHKERHLADIKRKLGITPLNELKQNITKSWQEVTTSTAYKRTSETLSQASLKATAAFTSMGSAISRKLEDVRFQSNAVNVSGVRTIPYSASMPVMRNAPQFKSFEEKVGTLKTKMSPSPSSQGDQFNSDPDSEAGSLMTQQQPEDSNTPHQEAPMH